MSLKKILVLRDGTPWAMLEHYYPGSQLHERARQKAIRERAPSQNNETTVFSRPLKILSRAEVTVPITTRASWDLLAGGTIRIEDFNSGILLMPSNNTTPPEQLVPVTVLQEGQWSYNSDNQLSPELRKAYADWQTERGERLATDQPLEQITMDHTALQRLIMQRINQDTPRPRPQQVYPKSTQ